MLFDWTDAVVHASLPSPEWLAQVRKHMDMRGWLSHDELHQTPGHTTHAAGWPVTMSRVLGC